MLLVYNGMDNLMRQWLPLIVYDFKGIMKAYERIIKYYKGIRTFANE